MLTIDNKQYRAWVAARWGIHLSGGEGFDTIRRLLGSRVEYRRRDAFALEKLERGVSIGVLLLRLAAPCR